MIITLNGRKVEFDGKISVKGLITARGLKTDSLVVEKNRSIVPRDEWDSVMVEEGDTLEVLSLVGGG
ncbi:MAG: sulfur carrier protein ThiS [Spirochaetes bacterium]|nr:MAG: sulfur carrier protein ThiS [Spirochaetota bacterium]